MPRPERPLDEVGGPVAELAAELRRLREKAGRPGYRQMAARVNYSVATLSAAASGRRLPTLEVTLAYVAACDGDRREWEERWREAERLSVAPAEDPVAADGHDRSPYPGLAMFRAEDAEFFFGRGALVDELVRRLERGRFLAVFGASGAGKSSLVRAGLVPAVAGPAMVLTPGAHPMAELAVHLARHAGVPAGGLLGELRADPARAHLMVRQGLLGVPSDVDLLVVVDQFEEAFASCADQAERADFIAALLAVCEGPDSRARVVLAVRADHYARFTEHPRLLAALTDAQVLIGGMSPAELREAVTRPAERCGARVEGALVATIVAEAGDSPGALPLAAHALREAWHRRRGALVTLAGYQAAGGVAGAVAHTAEQAFERLSEPERLVARRVLLRMVDVAPDGVVTRRRLSRTELDTIERASAVIEAFTAARLVSTDRDTVEITHEALIRAWPRLEAWLHEDRAELALHRRLTDAARIWELHGRDGGALYRGAPLAAWDGRGLDRLNEGERAFLRAGREARARTATVRRRRVRVALAGLTAAVVVTSLLAGFAAVQSRRANQQRDLARSNQLVAGARAQLQVDQEVALLLAVEAFDTEPTDDAQAALRQTVADSRVRGTVHAGHGQVVGVAFSPDGRTLASTGDDGTVRLWQRDGPDRVRGGPRVLRGPTSSVQNPVFSPDGRRIAVAGFDNLITVWDLSSGAASVLRGHRAAVSTIAFHPDGRRMASASGDGTVRLWDTTGADPAVELPVDGPPLGVAFSPDGRRLAVSGAGPIRVLNADGTGTPTLLAGHEGDVKKVTFSPDGRRLASAGVDGTVRVWPVTGPGEPVVLYGDDSFVETVVFSPDGGQVASSHSGSNTIRVWNPAGEADPVVLRGHDGAVWSLAFSPDGRLASGSADDTVRIWDPGFAADPLVLPGHDGPAVAVALNADGRRIVSGGVDGTVRVRREPWDAGPPLVLRGNQDKVRAVAITPDGRRVASAGRDGTVRVWDAETGAEQAVLRGHDGIVTGVGLSPDGRRVASAGWDGTVRVWSLDGAAPVVLRGHEDFVSGVVFSPDGRTAVSTGADGTVRIWPADGIGTPVVVQEMPPGRGSWRAAFSPDGTHLAVSGQDGVLHLRRADGEGLPTPFRGHRDAVWSVDFSADGRLLASSGQDGDGVRIWDVSAGREIVTVRGHGASAEQVRFAPDGRLVSAHGDGTVRIWRCPTCGPISEVRAAAGARATRPLTPEERAEFVD